jgi:hypothetical protein
MKKICRSYGTVMLLAVSAAWLAPPAAYARERSAPGGSADHASQSGGRSGEAGSADVLENSREAGLLTDWHLLGRYGHGGRGEFARHFAPERRAGRPAAKQTAQQAAKQTARHGDDEPAMLPNQVSGTQHYELLFPEGNFVLPRELAGRKGVFYALSSAYLTGGGDWNVYLESGAEAAVFVDGLPVLTRGAIATGALRGTIHAERGYHTVMVKFLAKAAPFRVAVLPLNSGSRRKNNTPYLEHSAASEYLMAEGRGAGQPRRWLGNATLPAAGAGAGATTGRLMALRPPMPAGSNRITHV